MRAGLTQRALAERAGLPQSTVARIETGRTDPSVTLLSRLLRPCGYDLEAQPALGLGVDRSQIQERLALSALERLQRLTLEARSLSLLKHAHRLG